MKDKDRVFELRKSIIDDWRWRRLHWRDIAYKYRIGKVWFYELRKRFLKSGYEGLRDKVRDNSNRPHRINWERRLKILSYVYDNPFWGIVFLIVFLTLTASLSGWCPNLLSKYLTPLSMCPARPLYK